MAQSKNDVMFQVGIVGANGYTGIELIRILDRHPNVSIKKVFSHSTAGQNLADIYPYLKNKYPLTLDTFNPNTVADLDMLFLAVPNGTSHQYMKTLLNHPNLKIIDLSADFRFKNVKNYEKYYKVIHESPNLLPQIPYGIPELYRKEIKSAKACSNPGCYATSVILGLYPLAKEGKITGSVIVDSKSGVTGAGRTLKESSLYCEANESITAYQTGIHRHLPEMEENLGIKLLFSPHLTPMNRGILSSIYIENKQNLTKSQILEIYQNYYGKEPFITLLTDEKMPTTKYVKGSNSCAINIQVIEDKIIIFSAIDNLIKGASGQAIQSMNLMLGLKETTVLDTLPLYI